MVPTAEITSNPAGSRGPLDVLGWAAYLACSWTWCIGMFLPVLLLRDYGAWGFVVFAVPNVVGAAAMGWVLRRPGASEEVLARHARACLAFTVVTVAFQVWFFDEWLGPLAGVTQRFPWETAPWVLVGVGVAWYGAAAKSFKPWASLAVWALSLSCGAFMFFKGGIGPGVPTPPSPTQGPTDILWLAPVCAFGFAMCPYLDATFLRARRELAGEAGTRAFVLGFGVLFFAMIAMTFGYAGLFGGSDVLPGLPRSAAALRSALIVHITVQIAFTIFAHVSVWDADASRSVKRTQLLLFLAIVLGIALPALGHAETVYRCFMSFYGLVFPAYVWLCMIPTRDGHSGTDGPRGRWKLAVLIAAVLLAAPCYWMGFIEREEWWLAPGLGIVLLLRLVVRAAATRRVLPESRA